MQPTIYLLSTKEVTNNTYKIMARLIFKKHDWRTWSRSTWLRRGSSARLS